MFLAIWEGMGICGASLGKDRVFCSMNCCRVEDRRFQGSFLAVIDRTVLDGLPEYTGNLGPHLNMDNADCID